MLFYEIKVHYQRQTGEDNPGAVKETYLVEGLTCADVESRLLEEIKPLIFGDCEVVSCKKAQFYDMLTSPEASNWYKARVELITVEDNGKETRKAVTILVQATTMEFAFKNLKEKMSNLDYEVISLQKSPILEVFRAVD